MEKLRHVGTIIFDYIINSLLLTVSLVLVVPFIAMYTGIFSQLDKITDARKLKKTFLAIKDNYAIIIKLTIFVLVSVALCVCSIIYVAPLNDSISIVVLVVSYVLLIFTMIIFVNSPILITNMNLTFKQLLFNSFTLIFGKWYMSILLFVFTIGILVLCGNYIYLTPLFVYGHCIACYKLSSINFLNLKARALNTTVNELKKDVKDPYFDEYGNVDTKYSEGENHENNE